MVEPRAPFFAVARGVNAVRQRRQSLAARRLSPSRANRLRGCSDYRRTPSEPSKPTSWSSEARLDVGRPRALNRRWDEPAKSTLGPLQTAGDLALGRPTAR